MHDVGLLDDYDDRAELASGLGCSQRTVARLENIPDGLPFVVIAGKKYYRREAVREWLLKRERKRNPRRVA